jgi:uncharacterized protein
VKAIFVDTSYWIALIHETDDLHNRAVAIDKKLTNVQLITSDMVLTELLNEFSKLGRHLRKLAADWVHGLRSRDDVKIVPQTSAQFTEALHIYETFIDKEWSLTDCASYLIMKERKITEALSHDHHFKQMGVNVLL